MPSVLQYTRLPHIDVDITNNDIAKQKFCNIIFMSGINCKINFFISKTILTKKLVNIAITYKHSRLLPTLFRCIPPGCAFHGHRLVVTVHT